jgi:hypothetical protein
MRQVFFIVLILFLSSISVMGQKNDGGFSIPPRRFRQDIRPEIKDSLDRLLDSLAHRNDSLKVYGYSDKRQLPGNPYLRPRHFNDDDMVFNPGPSFDRMPNADVTTPGVYYTLKIVPPVRGFPKQYRFNKPYSYR